jgi:hypothetical protein
MFTVTWAAAPAPPTWLARLQLGLVVVGVIAVLIGVPSDVGWLVWAGALMVFGALGLLAFSIVRAVRRSLRCDPLFPPGWSGWGRSSPAWPGR